MVMNVYSTFSRVSGLEHHYQMQFNVIFRTLVGQEGSYSSGETQSAYSTAPADWADELEENKLEENKFGENKLEENELEENELEENKLEENDKKYNLLIKIIEF